MEVVEEIHFDGSFLFGFDDIIDPTQMMRKLTEVRVVETVRK